MPFQLEAKKYTDPEKMASDFLAQYFGNQEIEYPINPFKILRDEGVLFTLSNFRKLEGVYVPTTSIDDIPVVGINVNRPITRQRFSGAHELCHHLRDADKQVACPIGAKDKTERFAESFAAALLMPLDELRHQVNQHREKSSRHIDFDDVLEIADYFGVSFESCLFRIAYRIHAILGDTEAGALKRRVKKYHPEARRKARHMTYTKLYEGLVNNCREQLAFTPTDHARYLFQNEYIYNDSRMEGLDVTIEQASEIVTDLRLKMSNSDFCSEENEAYMSIAGHYDMYQDILASPTKEEINVNDMFSLNEKLFSYYPYPGFGGRTRRNNTLVLGAKFETVPYQDIFHELNKLETEIKELHEIRNDITVSEFVEHVVRIHHRITVIHPFAEGNGRTARAFMNMQLVRAGLPPIYIKVEDKDAYINALSRADTEGVYDELYEMVFRILLHSHVELSQQ